MEELKEKQVINYRVTLFKNYNKKNNEQQKIKIIFEFI